MSVSLFCPICGAVYKSKDTHCFACGHPLTGDQADFQDENVIAGRYQIGNLLGSGGFSAVYQAKDLNKGGQVVALKQISLQGLSAEKAIEVTEIFNREVLTLSTLHHPQLPRLYDHFNDQDHWYLILEYIEGQTLETYLDTRETQGRPLHIEEILTIALQLCEVLKYLHERNPPLIYRDLKPGNIMRTTNGTLFLIDFGIARRFTPGQRRDTQPLGSPGYAAPEQYGRAQTTPQTDIFSLGALLHFLLSGQDPSENLYGLSSLRLGGKKGSAEMEKLVTQMLSPDPLDRPASMQLVAEELKRIKQQIITSTPATIWHPPTPQPSPWVSNKAGQIQMQYGQVTPFPPIPAHQGISRRNMLVGLGALAAGGVAATIGIKFFQNSLLILNEPSNADPLQLPVSPTPTVDPNQGKLSFKINQKDWVNGVAWSPDNKQFASACDDQTAQIWDGTTGKHLTTYQGHSDSVIDISWSPDGKLIASGSFDKTVQVWKTTNDKRIMTFLKHTDCVTGITWSSDSKYIASCSRDNTVRVWDVSNGNDLYAYIGHSDWVLDVAWSPNGKYIASCSRDRTVHVWNAIESTNLLIYTGHSYDVLGVAWSPNGMYIASCSRDHTVQIWEARNGNTIMIYQGHSRWVTGVAWSPDSKYIASCSRDHTVEIWDAINGNTIMTYQGHSNSVDDVAWSPDGKHIVSSSQDKTVQVWQPF